MFDRSSVGGPQSTIEFVTNVLQSSTEYSIIGEDLEGRILLWNEGARRLYGYEPEDIIGKVNADILHLPEDALAGQPRKLLDAALREGKWEGTIERQRKNGSRFTARVVITPRRNSSGEAIGFLLISKDISDENRLTDQLKANQYYTRSLIESNSDALIATDPAGIITDVNRQTELLTGRRRDDLIGSAFKGCFTDPERAENGLRLVLRQGKVTDYELAARSAQGYETVVSCNATTFHDRDGKLQGVLVAARDITESKGFEQALREKNVRLENADFAKDRFLATMSHELRTPLTAIIGFAGTLLMKLPGPLTADQERQVSTIRSSGKHLLSLINDLLDLAKIESGDVDLHLESVVCQSIIGEVAATLRPLVEAKGLSLDISTPPQDCVVLADRRALGQILLNLANNSVKFTDNGGIWIVLERRRADGHGQARISVIDTGIGIKDVDQGRLFKAFSQLNTRGACHEEGSGLGLHLSQKLAKLLRGNITFESAYGSGSTFTLSLDEK